MQIFLTAQIPAIPENLPAGLLLNARDHLQQGGLAAA